MNSAVALSVVSLLVLLPSGCLSPIQGPSDGGGGSEGPSGGMASATGGSGQAGPSGGAWACDSDPICDPVMPAGECDLYVHQTDDLSEVELGGAGGVTVCLWPIYK